MVDTTDGGYNARIGFRYQDMCAMYIALRSYIQNQSTFKHLYCEQDKLDFETWFEDDFCGYQVKNRKDNISAKEVNDFLRQYSDKSSKSGKSNRSFYFIFSQEPKGSLRCLFLKLRRNSGIRQYDKRADGYYATAVDSISLADFTVDYHYFEKEIIESLVYDLSRKILKNKLKSSQDIYSEVITDFLSRLRHELDDVSTKIDSNDRIFRVSDLEELIQAFLSRTIKKDYSQEGEIINITNLTPSDKGKPSSIKTKSPTVLGGREEVYE